ncbi:MAG: hypothetical protein G01um101430_375 [Parcubacteria group bacterium Gr01-1014_30]|nr:MAG: hypothetical protein G01um101430_375 [Parcubacteria group bacterium Gr01-1014_30]
MVERVKIALFENLANVLTSCRLIAASWLIVSALNNGQVVLMFVLAAFCVASDFFDGKVARYCGIESWLGSFLDRLADKIFVVPITIALILHYWPNEASLNMQILTAELAMVVILLELFLIVSVLYCLKTGVYLSANRWGKLKMGFESGVILVWLLSVVVEERLGFLVWQWSIALIDFGLASAVLFAVMSIQGYFQHWRSA